MLLFRRMSTKREGGFKLQMFLGELPRPEEFQNDRWGEQDGFHGRPYPGMVRTIANRNKLFTKSTITFSFFKLLSSFTHQKNCYVITFSKRTTNLFADDTSSYIIDSVPSLLESKLQERTDSLSIWFAKWHLTVNPTKSAVMVFRSRKMQAVNICITVDSHQVPQVTHHRHLGVTFSDTLGWTSHVDTIVRAASAKVGFLRRLRKRLNPLIMRQLYITCIRPSLEYASIAWGGLTRRDEEKLEKCNRSAARLIANISPSADIPREIVLARAGLPTMASRRKASQVRLAQAAVRGRLPDHLLGTFSSWTVPASIHSKCRNAVARFYVCHVRRKKFSEGLPCIVLLHCGTLCQSTYKNCQVGTH